MYLSWCMKRGHPRERGGVKPLAARRWRGHHRQVGAKPRRSRGQGHPARGGAAPAKPWGGPQRGGGSPGPGRSRAPWFRGPLKTAAESPSAASLAKRGARLCRDLRGDRRQAGGAVATPRSVGAPTKWGGAAPRREAMEGGQEAQPTGDGTSRRQARGEPGASLGTERPAPQVRLY